MYKIIGSDQKQYGPISGEQVREWIAQGRANASTQALAEGATDWKPLSSFPEFASAFSTPTSNVPPSIGASPTVSSTNASNKIAAGVLGILLGGFGVHKFILGYTGTGAVMLAVSLISLFGGFITCGITWFAYPVMHIIGLIEGIIYLTRTDEEFVRVYVQGRKEWF